MTKEEYTTYFEDAGSEQLMPPQIIDGGFKKPDNNMYGLTTSAQDRLLYGVDPLIWLSELELPPEAAPLIKLIAITVGQTANQLTHMRRLMILTGMWKKGQEAKQVLRTFYDKTDDKPNEESLKKLFTSLVATRGT